jgi:hypothetical protein
VTKLGRLSGSMIRAMAVLGYFLKIATMAGVCLVWSSRGIVWISLTVNVLALVNADLANGKLTVRGLSSTVTARKIVDDESGDLVARNVLDAILDNGDLVTRIAVLSLALNPIARG